MEGEKIIDKWKDTVLEVLGVNVKTILLQGDYHKVYFGAKYEWLWPANTEFGYFKQYIQV